MTSTSLVVPAAGGTAAAAATAAAAPAPATAPAAPQISGTTRLFVVIGDPVRQVRAPGLLNPLFAELGVDATLVPIHARPADFTSVVHALQLVGNLDGILVTVPHKVAAYELADDGSPAAAVSGSANVLRRTAAGGWFADNFDGAGFVRGLLSAGHDPAGKRFTMVGGGGAGSAVAVALLDAGCAHLSVYDRDAGRLDDLVARLAARWPGRVSATDAPLLDGVDVAVNATPLGLRPDDPLPFDPRGLRSGAVVADIVMKPPRTRLLRTAAEAGYQVHLGIHMLTHQVELYREFFQLDSLPALAGPIHEQE